MTFKTSSKRSAEIAAASKAQEHLTQGIEYPGLNDVLCGRGGHATNHPGNVQFRTLVSQYKDYYMGLSRYGKLQVAAEVVKLWRSQEPPGRFLTMTDPTRRQSTAWHDIGDKEAIKKTSQCLRERIPPHQKARTVTMIAQKAKALQLRQTKQDQKKQAKSCAPASSSGGQPTVSSTSCSSSRSNEREFEEWEERLRKQQRQLHLPPVEALEHSSNSNSNSNTSNSNQMQQPLEFDMQQQQQQHDAFLPRPILEPANISLAGSSSSDPSSGGSSSSNSSNSGSNSPLHVNVQHQHQHQHHHTQSSTPSTESFNSDTTDPLFFANFGNLAAVDSNNISNTQMQQQQSRHQYQPSWTTKSLWSDSDCGSNTNSTKIDNDEDFDTDFFMGGQIMDDDPRNNRNNQVDPWMIPSAANLTRDVFADEEDDSDILKPADVACCAGQQQQQQNQQRFLNTNLNATLSSGLGSLFASGF